VSDETNSNYKLVIKSLENTMFVLAVTEKYFADILLLFYLSLEGILSIFYDHFWSIIEQGKFKSKWYSSIVNISFLMSSPNSNGDTKLSAICLENTIFVLQISHWGN
jgi:hypothetical protein